MVEVEGERVRKVNPSSRKNTNPERGASLVEYALLVALLCVVAVGGVRAVGGGVDDVFTRFNEDAKLGSGGFLPAGDSSTPPSGGALPPDTQGEENG
jgi:Flp pilus assembly pilin Flp